MLRNLITLVTGVVILAGANLAVVAADPPSEKRDAGLDDALLEDLTDDLLGDLNDIPVRKDPPPDATGKPAVNPSGTSDLDQRLLENLDGEDIGQEQTDPLTLITRRMKSVEQMIERQQTASPTQRLQREIVEDLSLLIEQLRKQCQSQGGGRPQQSPAPGKSKPKQGKPGDGQAKAGNSAAKESTSRVGQSDADVDELDDMQRMLKRVWGHLPPKVREQMQSGSVERFLPKYEALIEQYYKRLAEEQTF